MQSHWLTFLQLWQVFPVNLLEELNRTVYWLTLISQEKERVIIFPHHINHRHVISLTKSDHE